MYVRYERSKYSVRFFRSKLEILCYHRTEYDLLCITFSSVEANVLYAVEQKISREVSNFTVGVILGC